MRGEVAKRGGGDALASLTTNDKEIDRNPHPPEGLGRDGPISLLFLLADAPASTRRLASIWSPSRSQQNDANLWDRTLVQARYGEALDVAFELVDDELLLRDHLFDYVPD